jgi:hypothetical protein
MSVVDRETDGGGAGEPIAGTCFGFAVRSSLDFHFLRSGEGEPLDITTSPSPPEGDAYELLQQWRPTADVRFETNLYRKGPLFRLQMGESSWFLIDTEQRRVVVPDDRNTVRREERLWGIPAILCFLARGDLQMHAAAVEIDGGAVLIAAPQVHGKTTLAVTFHNAGYRLLSEDVTCIRDLRHPHVVPGPAVLRVRLATAERIAVADAQEVGERDDRVHFAIAPERRGDCTPVPLRAILMLRESEDGYRLERPAAVDAVRDLWPLSFNLPTPTDRARCFAAVTDLVGTVRVENLFRPFRLEELPGVVSFVVDNV